MIGATGHGCAWSLFYLLAITDYPQPIPAWAALALHFGGREAILAVFSLAAMLPLYAGVMEDVNEGHPLRARIVGFLCTALTAALAWRWYTQGHTFYAVAAALLALPGLVDWRTPAKPPPAQSA